MTPLLAGTNVEQVGDQVVDAEQQVLLLARRRAAVDARRLMLPHLLPHSLGGIFLRFCGLYTLQLLARPAADDGPEIPGGLGHLPGERGPYKWCDVDGFPYGGSFDHCNGLLLLDDVVVNPATGKWAALPPLPPPSTESADDLFYRDKYLVFDPAASMHFEVVSIDRLSYMPDQPAAVLPLPAASEWPPSPCTMLVLSSRTWRWEERSFLREGEAAGTLADVRSIICSVVGKGYAVLWKGELYVQCESNFVMRYTNTHCCLSILISSNPIENIVWSSYALLTFLP